MLAFIRCKHILAWRYASMGITMLPDDESKEVPARAAGGVARAAALSKAERKEIAQKAAQARWQKHLPTALFGSPDRPVRIGDKELQCYVLDDDEQTRVITQADFLVALGRHRKARVRKMDGEDQVPAILYGKGINPFISKEFLEKTRPIIFRLQSGGKANGFRAELLPEVCEIYLKARDADALPPNQKHVAVQAEIIVRGLARVGIIALVDEATGYQQVREKMALQAILDAFLRKELAAWAKRFPDEFYEHIFRLRGWPWKGRKKNPPQVVASYTKDIVYARLAPQIMEELERRNPIEGGRRKSAHHQWLTEDVGHPALAQHLHAVITLMRVSRNWNQFKGMLNIAHPKRGDTLQLPLMADFPTDPQRASEKQASLFDKEAAN
jgi:hypothetical protein